MRKDPTMRSVPGYLAARGAAVRDSAGPRAPGVRGWAWRLAQAVGAPSPAAMRRIALAGVVGPPPGIINPARGPARPFRPPPPRPPRGAAPRPLAPPSTGGPP